MMRIHGHAGADCSDVLMSAGVCISTCKFCSKRADVMISVIIIIIIGNLLHQYAHSVQLYCLPSIGHTLKWSIRYKKINCC